MLITKTNLLASKESLRLAKLGYELMDRKRVILMQELSKMMEDVKALRDVIDKTYDEAYLALQRVNVSVGSLTTKNVAQQVPVEDGIKIVYRSVMGIEIPKTEMIETKETKPVYRMSSSNELMDLAYQKMQQVKVYTVRLAELDNGMYRLAKAIEKSRKRANALEHIVIPDLEMKIKVISDALEEKEREEFIRMKLVKQR